jgi:hypothetical protein
VPAIGVAQPLMSPHQSLWTWTPSRLARACASLAWYEHGMCEQPLELMHDMSRTRRNMDVHAMLMRKGCCCCCCCCRKQRRTSTVWRQRSSCSRTAVCR